MSTRHLRNAIVLSLAMSTFGWAQDGEAERSTKQQLDQKAANLVSQLLMQRHRSRNGPINILIQQGSETEADEYYARISVELRFAFAGSDMQCFFNYLGYQGLSPSDIERLPSFDLMPTSGVEFESLAASVDDPVEFRRNFSLADFEDGRVLVSRFFAPKIVSYFDRKSPGDPVDPRSLIPGWRKLVRLQPKSGSVADGAGVKHVYLLFNLFEPDVSKDPFEGNESGNNQVIIVPRTFTPKTGNAVYFAVYQSRTNAYRLGKFLQAGFDLPGVHPQDGVYYVPRSCAECHGHDKERGEPYDYPFAKPNYLDTDQWYDSLDFDFPHVATSAHDVVFDGGKNHSTAQYRRAFQVIRRLNATIKEETIAAERTNVPSFQRKAVEKWVDLHAAWDDRVPFEQRALEVTSGVKWDPGNSTEMRFVRHMNRFCFRCHSSVRFNIFDKSGMVNEPVRSLLPQFVPPGIMPQGRVLEVGTKTEIVDLFRQINGN